MQIARTRLLDLISKIKNKPFGIENVIIQKKILKKLLP